MAFCVSPGSSVVGGCGRREVCVRGKGARGVSRRLRVVACESKKRDVLEIVQDPRENKFYMSDPKKGRRELNLREKEFLFMDALYSYGADNEQPIISDEQFDMLKEDLTWEGSRVILLNEKERKFLGAARAYYRGNPTMSDEEFDSLREELRMAGSSVAVSKGPKCSLETMTCETDCEVDKRRKFITYLPAAGIGALVWAALTFELTPLRHINHLYTLVGGLPIIAFFSAFVTGIILPPPALILVGACPNCGEEVRSYFGDIATIKGPTDMVQVKCGNCKTKVKVMAETRKMELQMDAK
eukprot:CAMPEP_0198722668 /NCGR_PEP_ID=MMETSP1475-20131203/300_1 /TAXON_ID= ORGANISM="Unidentified sp., Strain CCMP1999" /NCGR_SAMPLE_ID=MMETSP1475 /ASSEMBLY_ACC=CAM_ASM_001111 /LENGTH=298 /DNA_ID=CAMNT_0044483581 /DNA_START=53 /DNA_END=949 /DNA_ORIENTATION=-